MSQKATFTTFETSSGVKIQRIPLEAFPGFWAYVYLIQVDEDCVLIDSGSGTDRSHENLLSGLQQVGSEPSALTHVVLTHAHIDHYGGLTKLRPLTKAKIGVHELDLQTVAHHEARLALISRRLDSFLVGTGLSAGTCEQVLSIYRFTKGLYRSVPVDFTLRQSLPSRGGADEALDMQLAPFEFIHLPGHCPGHVAIRLDDVVFCGDMVVEGVTPHLSPESINPFSGLAHYLESLARLKEWSKGARFILNGHNEAITDLPSHIASTKRNILRRIGKAIEALRIPLTIEEVCQAVYGETSGYNLLLVIEKTGAYVEYLYEHGLIGIANPGELEQGLPARYQQLRDEALLYVELERKVGSYTGIQATTEQGPSTYSLV